ncbi:MAG TPA: tryptophan halogenase family protein [Sphingomicrobium sp.]|nr:tryptophan halogenase family protein [Sphingomicrobium sp.]
MSGGTRPGSILILGGGTAGWMAANLFQHRWGALGTRVALIESSEIGIIGVGEGSTPQLKAFFDTIGISEQEWMPRCNATYKTGIGFHGWSQRAGFESYFHPFPTAVDGVTAPQFFYNTRARRTGRDVHAHPDRFFLPTALARQRKAPLAPANFPFATSYGYHFDAHLVGAFLREVATRRGVEHIEARIASVELTPEGDVAALLTADGGRFEAEFFVDASGFRALVIEGALGEPHIGFGDNLFNDRAVVAPTPLPAEGPGVCTRATACSAGWIWHIPLTNRVGNGYVYSSRYIDDEAAAAELREHVDLAPDAPVRQLKMRVGRIERSWVGNCLAIGLAQGFLEPLEATALHIVLTTVESFIEIVERGCVDEPARAEFNRVIGRRYEGIRDYIVCHYRTARRRDTEYWRDAAGHDRLSDSLKGLITAWFTGADLEREVSEQDISGYYSALSWHCMLAGYGNFPDDSRIKPPGPDIETFDMAEIDRFIAGCALNFPPHEQALDQLAKAA